MRPPECDLIHSIPSSPDQKKKLFKTILGQTVEFCEVRLNVHLDSCHLLLLATRKTSTE